MTTARTGLRRGHTRHVARGQFVNRPRQHPRRDPNAVVVYQYRISVAGNLPRTAMLVLKYTQLGVSPVRNNDGMRQIFPAVCHQAYVQPTTLQMQLGAFG